MNKITFVTNAAVNTLDYVKLLLQSLKDNLKYKEHEIIVFVDSDNEGTVEYLRSIKKDFYDLKIITHHVKPCVGYTRNNNLLVELASHDIVSYLQSDMVVSKNYDVNILEDLEDNCILSSTRIEPPLHGISDKTITADFGLDPKEFKYKEFLEYAESKKSNKTLEYFFAPFTFYKHVWLDYGGYDTIFRRSREDSDLLQRFVVGGVKIKQTFKANVYHFSCVTSRGRDWFNRSNNEAQKRVELQQLADSIELRRFFRKWGGFSHGESKDLQKYDCDLVLKGVKEEDIKDIMEIEPFFSRVWLDSESCISTIKKYVSKEHEPANLLLKFSHEDWSFANSFYNQTDYDSIYNIGEPKDWNAKIEANSNGIKTVNSILRWIPEMIKTTDPGIYSIDENNAYIDIIRAEIVGGSVQLKASNPPFDMALINIE